MKNKKYIKKHIILALKIGVGSSLAIMIANGLRLDNAVSAGTIALLTLMTTRWETVRLSFYRLITFLITLVIAWTVFLHVDNNMVAYGLFIFLTVLIAECLGWRATISVNAVAGAHLLISHDFSRTSILNEFAIVVIGIAIALVINLFNDNRNHRKTMIADMRKVEDKLQTILGDMASYLTEPQKVSDVWEEITDLEEQLHSYMEDAREYQDNTFQSHPVYYIGYFEMRYDQCQVLYSLHSSMGRIRSVPDQARVVADFIHYLTDYVIEKNDPLQQERKLEQIFEDMKKEDMPRTREEFESRALLFHILMDLESFLEYKRGFVEKLDEKQRQRYWDS